MNKCLAFASPLGGNIKVCTKLIEKLFEHSLENGQKVYVTFNGLTSILILLTIKSESVPLSKRKKTGQTSFLASSGENGGEEMAWLLCCVHITFDYPTCSQTLQLISSLILLPIFRKTLSTEVKRRVQQTQHSS